MMQLRKEFELEIQKTEHVFISFLAKLEIKVERMELKVARLEEECWSRVSQLQEKILHWDREVK